MNSSRLSSLIPLTLILLLSACGTPTQPPPTITPTTPSDDLQNPVAGTEHDEGYGSHSLNVITGISGNGSPILNGYTSYEGSRARNYDKDAVMIVANETVNLNGEEFHDGDIIIFVEDNTPEIALPGTVIVINRDITVHNATYTAGRYTVSDDGTLTAADE